MHTDTSLQWLTDLKLDFLSIFQGCDLLPPVEEVCVVDDVAAELREVEHAGVVTVQLVMGGLDKPVTEAGLACTLSSQTVVAGGGEATHCHTHHRYLALASHY